jgi:hypothetical protein
LPRAGAAEVARGLHQAALLGLGVVLIRLAGLTLFRVLLPALRMPTPRIVEDIVVIGGYLLWGMVRLSYAGVELSSLVATSAVITAVLAFAMQDTLGNILGGLALQLDNSLEIGDWVKVDDVCRAASSRSSGATPRSSRATARRVVVPNAQLMKGKFAVIGDAKALAGRGAGAAGSGSTWPTMSALAGDRRGRGHRPTPRSQRRARPAPSAWRWTSPGIGALRVALLAGRPARRRPHRFGRAQPPAGHAAAPRLAHRAARPGRCTWCRRRGASQAAWQRELARRIQGAVRHRALRFARRGERARSPNAWCMRPSRAAT